MHSHRLISRPRVQLAFLALVFASFICIGMLVGRAVVFGQFRFGFLPGNLLLAWIPLVCAMAVYSIRARQARRRVLLATCAVIWFFFYPNAPYLITDLVHLKTRAPVPRWFDLVLMMSFAWTGLFLGNLSLYLMQEVVRAWRGRAASWCFAVVMLALGAVGVFVGRVWRWNSWEVVTSPWELTSKALRNIGKMGPEESALFAATFFAFSLITYLTVYTLTHLHGYVERNAAPDGAKPDARSGA